MCSGPVVWADRLSRHPEMTDKISDRETDVDTGEIDEPPLEFMLLDSIVPPTIIMVFAPMRNQCIMDM